MGAFIQNMEVLVVLGVIVLGMWAYFRKFDDNPIVPDSMNGVLKNLSRNNNEEKQRRDNQRRDNQRKGTVCMSFWIVENIDHNGRVKQSKDLVVDNGKGYYIGRSNECEFKINNMKVSEKHAVISQDEKGFFIRDCGSTNGIWHNEKKIDESDISDGMILYIANECLKFRKLDPFNIQVEDKEHIRRHNNTNTQVFKS